jgi:hypothetical protein
MKYGDKVKVISGFYEGQQGEVIGLRRNGDYVVEMKSQTKGHTYLWKYVRLIGFRKIKVLVYNERSLKLINNEDIGDSVDHFFEEEKK